MRRLLKQVDVETGEILDGVVVQVGPPRRNGFVGGWVAMAQEPLLELVRSGVGGETLRVFLAVVARLDFQNLLVLNQTEIAREIGMRRPNVSRAIRELLRVGILLQGPRVGVLRSYRLNPRFGWKGSSSGHRKVLKLELHRGGAGGSSGGSRGEPVRA